MNSPAYLTSEQAAEEGRCTIVACGPGVEPELVGEALADGGLKPSRRLAKTPNDPRVSSGGRQVNADVRGAVDTETIAQSSPVAPES